jgi:hypothetical protein
VTICQPRTRPASSPVATSTHAAYPARDRVTLPDVAATIDMALGLPPETPNFDPFDRSLALSTNTSIKIIVI